jgi:serpin B
MKHVFIMLSFLATILACDKTRDLQKPGEKEKEKEKEATPISLTTKQLERVAVDNAFSFEMFRRVAREDKENALFSPLGLNMALGMLYNGTSGETRGEMAAVMGMAGFSIEEFNAYYKKIADALLAADPLTEMGIVNSIWSREGFPVLPAFVEVNAAYFDAVARTLDFSKPGAVNTINAWCAEKTKNRIPEIIKPPISETTVMYLMNAIYFKNKWRHKFDKKDSKVADFTTATGAKKRVTLMEQTTTFPYYEDELLECVELPYGNGAFSMAVILPRAGTGLDALVDQLDNDKWNSIVAKLYPTPIRLKLPRFTANREMDLITSLKDASITRIFSDLLAEFDNLSAQKVFVSLVKQKTFAEVNEEGTEAAAVTVVGVDLTFAGPTSDIPFFANRPFLYLIRERSTGAILFIGRMNDPEEA